MKEKWFSSVASSKELKSILKNLNVKYLSLENILDSSVIILFSNLDIFIGVIYSSKFALKWCIRIKIRNGDK